MKNLVIKLIRAYQRAPLKTHGACKFYPTCSEYMIQAIEYHGLLIGILKGIWRILRCNPFSKGGYDPVKK
ncbi:MAG: membrane protein insertion efficiency factor YidD [Bacilli bacterium]|nr:membrane protein insertion efficiency factor YidD [Bacilli bacterium]